MFQRSIMSLLTIFVFSVSGQTVQSPDEFLGYSLGTRFSRHSQVEDYFKQLVRNSPSTIQLKNYGKTTENRNLFVAFISNGSDFFKSSNCSIKLWAELHLFSIN